MSKTIKTQDLFSVSTGIKEKKQSIKGKRTLTQKSIFQ